MVLQRVHKTSGLEFHCPQPFVTLTSVSSVEILPPKAAIWFVSINSADIACPETNDMNLQRLAWLLALFAFISTTRLTVAEGPEPTSPKLSSPGKKPEPAAKPASY